jgi:tetratricopeptide (TPR) repeat protein
LPLPQYAIGLGDTLAAAGRAAEAGEAYALVGVMERLLEANGVRTELETALFDLDHGRSLARALARAREAYRRAPGIHAEDVLAWALYKNGRCQEALAHSERALRLGTLDALMLFHRGMIERCLGRHEAGRAYLARALAINPHFSLAYAPIARRALR